MRLEQMSSNIYFPDSVLRILKRMLLLGLSVLLNVMKRFCRDVFRDVENTLRIGYSCSQVNNKIQVATWEELPFQQRPLQAERIPAARSLPEMLLIFGGRSDCSG